MRSRRHKLKGGWALLYTRGKFKKQEVSGLKSEARAVFRRGARHLDLERWKKRDLASVAEAAERE